MQRKIISGTSSQVKILLVFNVLGYKNAQAVPSRKNKPESFEHEYNIVIHGGGKKDKNNINLMRFAKQVRYITTLKENDAKKELDRDFCLYLCKCLLDANKNVLLGFSKLNYEMIADDLKQIYQELVINSQKAIMEKLLKDDRLAFQISMHFKKQGVLLPKNRALWVQNDKIRKLTFVLANDKDIKASFIFEFRPNYFSVGAQNDTILDKNTEKNIQERIAKALSDIKEGKTVLDLHQVEDFEKKEDQKQQEERESAGAGLGTFCCLASILKIANQANIQYRYGPTKNERNFTVVKAEFFLDKPFSTELRKILQEAEQKQFEKMARLMEEASGKK